MPRIGGRVSFKPLVLDLGLRESVGFPLFPAPSLGFRVGFKPEGGRVRPPVGEDGTGNGTGGINCPDDSYQPLTDEQKSQLFNPYQQTAAQDLLNKLSNDATEIFGHQVEYFVTDPDARGIDHSIHEFGLFNIVCEGDIKVAVNNNQFPDNTISTNIFDLTLIDSFEVHITKEMFKQAFGV